MDVFHYFAYIFALNLKKESNINNADHLQWSN